MSAYDRDYYGWANAQAALLREVQPEWLDWRNLAEEVEDATAGGFRGIVVVAHAAFPRR